MPKERCWSIIDRSQSGQWRGAGCSTLPGTACSGALSGLLPALPGRSIIDARKDQGWTSDLAASARTRAFSVRCWLLLLLVLVLGSTRSPAMAGRAGLVAAAGRPACVLVTAGADVFGTVRLVAG